MPSPPFVCTIVVAAGAGTRFGADKLAVAITGDTTALDLSLATAAAASDHTVLVVRSDDLSLYASPGPDVSVVAGGATRSESVRAGLAAMPEATSVVLVHDAARPLADSALFARVIDSVVGGAAAVVPVIPVVDTIRSVEGGVVDRELLRAVQTPQGFAVDVLKAVHSRAADATDDASLVEAAGHRVVLVDGDVRNLKITRPADIAMARALLEE